MSAQKSKNDTVAASGNSGNAYHTTTFRGALVKVTSNGCKRYPDCFTCIFSDCQKPDNGRE